MQHIRDTLKFVKKNKTRTIGCYLLDLLFLIIIIMTVVNYIPTWIEYAEHSNNLIKELAGDDISALTLVASRSQEIQQVKQSMENIMGKMLLIIFTAGNVIYALWAGIALKKLKLWYISMFVIVNYILQFVLWLIFSLIIDLKSSLGSIIAESSRASIFIFIVLCYFAYYKLFVFMIYIDDKKGFKIGFKKYVKFMLSNNLWKSFWRYSVASLIFFPVLIFTQVPVISNFDGTKMLISFGLTLLVLIPYTTISKLYIIKTIENN